MNLTKITVCCVFIGLSLVAAYRYFNKPKLNVILISIDTLRADRLGAYGYSRNTSPVMDGLAREGSVFQFAVSVAPWTLPSHVTMLTGLYPETHGLSTSRRARIGSELPTLQKILRGEGYFTAAFTGGGYVSRRYGFDNHFDHYVQTDDFKNSVESDLGSALKLARLKLEAGTGDKPFFFFIHGYDVHCPYGEKPPYDQAFKSVDAAYVDPERCGDAFYNKAVLTSQQAAFLSDQYDGSIKRVDDLLGGFFQFLREQNLYDRTIIVITSDHGEEFLEHGRIGHQHSLHREVLMIPLIIKVPGLRHQSVEHPVSLVDLSPTLTDLIGISSGETVDGASLKRHLSRGDDAGAVRQYQRSSLDRDAVLRSLIDRRHHYIENIETQGAMLFDAEADILEKEDLSVRHPALFAQMRELISAGTHGTAMAQMQSNDAAEESHADAQNIERLKSLGYLN